MLIDDTQPEETRVVVINGNKLEDVEFETSSRKQIKGNIYLGKVMRVEPSLQACFVDYGGNKHGFMAFGEIHPDYYNLSAEELAAIDKEVDDIIENKKQAIKEREIERERLRQEKEAARAQARRAYEESMAQKAAQEAQKAEEKALKDDEKSESENEKIEEIVETVNENKNETANESTEEVSETTGEAVDADAEVHKHDKKRTAKKRYRKQHPKTEAAAEGTQENAEPLKVMAAADGIKEESIKEETGEEENFNEYRKEKQHSVSPIDEDIADDDDDEMEMDFEMQKKLLKARKLFHRSKIQEVIKEGQTLLVQVVKEERGNKGAALTTYLSLAGRYCVLMPNRIKSGGVSRKITNVADRNRLKSIVRELPLTSDMSIIVRTAGEEKSKADIVRDYNYLIRTWNQVRVDALKNKAPALIHEEGNLIKRALRDIYTKDISEIIVSGDDGYKLAKDFFRILSPHNLKKIKHYRNSDMPLFQRFQVEGQLDKLHEVNAQLESGGYLVINPTEALISIDVNSGRATKEKDLEDTALKTNLEACDEIARQLRMRNLAGLVVIDFIDMEEPANNHAVERRMKEAMKKDRSRIQIGKMSMFGLLELSRQRMHSSFFESNYEICPHCNGKGIIRTTESSAVFVLRGIEEEGIKNRSSRINVYVPSDIAIYLLNQKRQNLIKMEDRYKMEVIISADDSIKNIADYKIERTKAVKGNGTNNTETAEISEGTFEEDADNTAESIDNSSSAEATTPVSEGENKENNNDGSFRNNRRRRDNRRNRRGRERNERNNGERNERNNSERNDRNNGERNDRNNNKDNNRRNGENNHFERKAAPAQEAVILYNSHEDTKSKAAESNEPAKEKSTWWKKLIKG